VLLLLPLLVLLPQLLLLVHYLQQLWLLWVVPLPWADWLGAVEQPLELLVPLLVPLHLLPQHPWFNPHQEVAQ
jgi:hypothetical protein